MVALPALAQRRLARTELRQAGEGYSFALPFLLPFLVFTILPLAFGVLVSFTNWSIIGAPQWVGLHNYISALSNPLVRQAFLNTLRYVVLVVPVVTLLGLVFALYVNQRWPGHLFARVSFYASNVVSAPVIGLVWVWMLDAQFGIINHYLHTSIPWLTSTNWSWIGVSIATVWWDTGLIFVLFLAGLQEINGEILEAAKIDGAGPWRSLRRIVLPLLRRTFILAITLEMISTFQIFSQVNVMTAGGPANSSASAMQYLYSAGIGQLQLGYASAIGVMLFVLTVIGTMIFRLLFRDKRW
ncbi:MAG TPA: sugar ABC transporter permease [Streptosporangiaceae bacterium]|nr:sugar ABC transporter permease [Streptosporangiaceae bacterium]